VLLLSENCVILASVILSQDTQITDDKRQTNYIMAVAELCNTITAFS